MLGPLPWSVAGLSWRTPPCNHCVSSSHCKPFSHIKICGNDDSLESSSYCLWLPVRIRALGEQTSGPTPVSLPPAPRTVCLLPSGYSEKKQEATFLSGGTREGFVGEEIFKERERHGEKSQRRMLKHSQRVYGPPTPSPRWGLICPN